MGYCVIGDNAAGEYWIDYYNNYELWSNDNPDGKTFQDITGAFASIIFEGTKEECEKYIDDLAKNTVRYAVYYDRAAGEGFTSEENATSGNWKGSKYGGHASYITDFATEEEASDYLRGMERQGRKRLG